MSRVRHVEGVCGEDEIAALWGQHFQELFNSVPSDMDALIGDTVGDCEHAHISVEEVGEAIR